MRLLTLLLLLWCSNIYAVPSFVPLRPLMTGYLPSSNSSPLAQTADKAFDGDINSKYLNFDRFNTGVTISLSQGKVVSGIQFTTAEDAVGRDPTSFVLYGSNDNAAWVKIDNQPIALSDYRQVSSNVYTISNTNAYVYYKIEFPSIKDTTCGQDCNSMQIAEIVFIYDENNPTTSVDLGTTAMIPFPSVYCCGGSGSAFSPNIATQVSMLIFKQSPAMNYAGINQTGRDNTITIEQIGSSRNAASYVGTGDNNIITITQEAINDLQPNYLTLSVNGNNNLIDIDQNSYSVISSAGKGAFINIANDNNHFTLQQKDSGDHISYVNLLDGNKTVNILQQGTGNHMADITLSGQPVGLSLQQSGATQQFYSINFNCATFGGCQPIQVQQGQ